MDITITILLFISCIICIILIISSINSINKKESDTVDLATTITTTPINIGDNKINVESANDFQVGMNIKIGSGDETDYGIITGFGSIIIDTPANYYHPVGTQVIEYNNNLNNIDNDNINDNNNINDNDIKSELPIKSHALTSSMVNSQTRPQSNIQLSIIPESTPTSIIPSSSTSPSIKPVTTSPSTKPGTPLPSTSPSTKPVTISPSTKPGTPSPSTKPGTPSPSIKPGTTSPSTKPGTTPLPSTKPVTTPLPSTTIIRSDNIKKYSHINLKKFMLEAGNQGNTNACESFSMIYYLGNYYKMINDLNLGIITNKNYLDILNQQSENISNYYNDNKNILNPLYFYTYGTNCKRSPNVTTISTIKRDASVHGLLSYHDYSLNYNPPSIDSKNNIFVNCSSILAKSKASTVTIHNPYAPNGIVDINIKSSNCINDIKDFLNIGIPLIVFINISNTFKHFYNKKNILTFPNINENSIYNDNNPTYDKEGHIVTLIGYVENVPAAKKIDNSDGVFIIINSWGPTFGDDGVFYITYNTIKTSLVKSISIVGPNPNNKELYNLYNTKLSQIKK